MMKYALLALMAMAWASPLTAGAIRRTQRMRSATCISNILETPHENM